MSTLQVASAWGEASAIPGTPFRLAMDPSVVDDRLVVLQADMPPGLRVPPHVHDDADQLSVVVSGRVGFRVDADEVVLEQGGSCIVPRGSSHELWNAGEGFAQVLEIYTPAGIEQMFRAAGEQALAAESSEAGEAEYRAQGAAR